MFHSVCASSYCLNFDKSPYVRESRTVLDSGFHTVDSGFQVFGFQYLSVELVLWIPIVIRVPDSLSCIPDSQVPFHPIPESTAKIFRIPLHGSRYKIS